MASNQNKKSYGLIISQKKHGTKFSAVSKPISIFSKDSSEEDEAKAKAEINKEIKEESKKKISVKQTQIEMQRALDEDPTVYQYDEIYDDLEAKKIQVGSSNERQDKKPKYIEGLLKSAAARKREQERREERKIQKERQEEGDQYEDKEAFVTSSYRKKMVELQEEEEKQKRQDEADAANDVTKQKDLSQFYRHLLTKNVAMGGAHDTGDIKTEERSSDDAKILGKVEDGKRDGSLSPQDTSQRQSPHQRDTFSGKKLSSRADSHTKSSSKHKGRRVSPDSPSEDIAEFNHTPSKLVNKNKDRNGRHSTRTSSDSESSENLDQSKVPHKVGKRSRSPVSKQLSKHDLESSYRGQKKIKSSRDEKRERSKKSVKRPDKDEKRLSKKSRKRSSSSSDNSTSTTDEEEPVRKAKKHDKKLAKRAPKEKERAQIMGEGKRKSRSPNRGEKHSWSLRRSSRDFNDSETDSSGGEDAKRVSRKRRRKDEVARGPTAKVRKGRDSSVEFYSPERSPKHKRKTATRSPDSYSDDVSRNHEKLAKKRKKEKVKAKEWERGSSKQKDRDSVRRKDRKREEASDSDSIDDNESRNHHRHSMKRKGSTDRRIQENENSENDADDGRKRKQKNRSSDRSRRPASDSNSEDLKEARMHTKSRHRTPSKQANIVKELNEIKMGEEKEKDPTLVKRLKVFAKRNDKHSIEAAKRRFLLRQKARLGQTVSESESDEE